MRQVKENAKLTDVVLNLKEAEPNGDCTQLVTTSCRGYRQNSPLSCHRFYKCIEGAAYSCQNPKFLKKTCSERYWNKDGKDHYSCDQASPDWTTAAHIVCASTVARNA